MQHAAERVHALADACAGLVLRPSPHCDGSDWPEAKLFAAACSFRIALPLGRRADRLALVSSDLRGAVGAPSYWVTPATGSLVGATLQTGRTTTVEGPAAQDFTDSRHLAGAEGAASFLCLPIPAGGSLASVAAPPPAAALLLSYPSPAAAPQEELRLALLLAGQLAQRHGDALQQHAARLSSGVHPAEHSVWGPGIDADYPELSSSDSDAWEDVGSAGGSSGASSSSGGTPERRLRGQGRAAGRGMEGAAAGWTMCARTLRFADGQLERRFRRWRNTRLARVDVSALLALLTYHAAACLLPPFTSCHAAGLASGMLPTLALLVPLLLLLLKRCNRWYKQHRDRLLACTYLLLACHNGLDLAAQLQAAPEGAWHDVLPRLEGVWCLVLGLVLQVQFVGQCAMVAGSLLIKALLQPSFSDWAFAAAARSCSSPSTRACLLGDDLRSLLLQLLLPCGLAYYTELCARRAFSRTVRTPS